MEGERKGSSRHAPGAWGRSLAGVELVVLVVQQQHLNSIHHSLLQMIVLEAPTIDLDSRDDFAAGSTGSTGLAGQLAEPAALDDGSEALQ